MNLMSSTVSNVPVSPAALAASADAEPVKETVIEPKKGWIGVDWPELSRGRELLYFLVWRDVKVRYKQATLGVLWAVLVPLIQVAIFSIIFGSGLNLASQLSPKVQHAFPVFIFAAMLGWQVINRSLNEGGLSLVSQQHLLTKIYFPRLFVPTSAVGGAMFDMLISLPVFVVVMAFYRVVPPWTVVFFPFLMLLTAMLGAGLAYTVSALTVTYRDLRFVIPFAAQIWMYLSFVMFPVPESIANSPKWKVLFHFNPAYGIVTTFRKVLMGESPGWSWTYLASSIVITVVLLIFGLFYFKKTERRFADIA
ncbi:MAG: putative polysaccharide transporter permease protein [Phycisphaerales bacterium]|nr:putative polysaccharide transporter permease protein [Phycisphaerales bacterium]